MLDRYVFAWDTATNRARANFVFLQFELVTSYCHLAEKSDSSLLSNRLKSARRTYENVIRFMLRADLRRGELNDITSDAERLKFKLEVLEAECNGRRRL